MRRWMLLALAAALLLCAACSPQTHPFAHVTQTRHMVDAKRFGDAPPGNPAVGDILFAGSGHWSGSPTSFAYAWEDCDSSGANCATASGSPTNTQRYAVVSGDLGSTLRVAVTASYSGHPSATVTSAPTGVVSSSGATVVGSSGAPTPTCTVTATSVTAATSDLASAASGSTVCLATGTGSYGAMSITSNVQPASNVTFSPVTPGAVTIAGIATHAIVNNLTIEGFKFSDCMCVDDTGNHIKIFYNDMENFSNYAVQGCPACTNSTNDLSNLDVEYNQIDHTAYCLRGAANSWSSWTFSHNVCGPGIGSDGSIDDHYLQTECISGITIDNNAFEGPFNATSLSAGAHNNITHACGSNLVFDNNIIYHGDSRAQALLWGDDGNVTTAEAKNNLFVQDPTCGSTCPEISMWLDGNGSSNSDSNVNFSNNTIIGSNIAQATTGGIFSRAGGITNFTVEDNISVNNNAAGSGDYSLGTCTTCDHNVSKDSSASGTGSVTGWTPSWQSTSWTPTDGSPWSPPPSGYYQPNVGGGVTSGMGYQGTIGP